jgi:hypothetical protein
MLLENQTIKGRIKQQASSRQIKTIGGNWDQDLILEAGGVLTVESKSRQG